MPAKVLSVSLAGLVALTVGCDLFGPGQRWSHALTMFWCGPPVGAATGIVLAQEPIQSVAAPYPHVGIVIRQGAARIAGHTWKVTSDSAVTASYDAAPGKFESALFGTVTVSSVDTAYTVQGTVALRFPSRFVETHFTAPWIHNGIVCN